MGGLRNVVRQELVARQLAEQLAGHFGIGRAAGGLPAGGLPAGGLPAGGHPLGGPAHGHPDRQLRVLDAGCGQGTQTLRLARAGHLVTGLDPDPATLGAAHAALAAEGPEVRGRVRLLAGDGRECGRWFEPGSFDVVLCHGVLMYLPEPGPMLAALARVLAPGGMLSLLVRNGGALAMRPGLAGDWRGALQAFDGGVRYTNRLGLATRADRLEDLAEALDSMDVPLRDWYGVRVFTDTAPDDAPLPADGRQLAQLLDAEERAGREDPYRGVAALLHVVGARRPAV
ncbi:methyltransferase domain-containing protein [Streptacidiphilus sp. ASG 303]|uniref:class I SAM-dependent methyltransferase n=1 Tax=Streptacidiphilus sp. ASG 303 TaxID=2896847 RepID=UPI001E292D9A|nr:class I SAM-dependent methyltransferase [Streptacidiphilus sp. ASG 303]MCD0481717.1 methyltransferase domain-containing protein [Streptacidiphilus sp. ASG 303]